MSNTTFFLVFVVIACALFVPLYGFATSVGEFVGVPLVVGVGLVALGVAASAVAQIF